MRRWPIFLAPPAVLTCLIAACGEDSPGIPPPAGSDASTSSDSSNTTADRFVPPADGSPPIGDASPNQDSGDASDGGDPIADAGPDVVVPVDTAEILFDTPQPNAVGRRVIARGDRIFWLYDVGARSFIATNGPNGARVDLVETDTIAAFDVRNVVAWTANGHAYARPTTAAVSTPIDFGPASCVSLTSSTNHVYCRGKDNTVVRWALAGIQLDASVIATEVPEGPDIVTDDSFLYLSESQGNISRIPLNGFPDAGPPSGPQYRLLAQNQANPRELAVGVPGDNVVYWAVGYDGGTIRGASKVDGTQASTAGQYLAGLRTFTHYSQRAGAYGALDNRIVFVRFGQQTIQPFHPVDAGVNDMSAVFGTILWIDQAARVWRADP